MLVTATYRVRGEEDPNTIDWSIFRLPPADAIAAPVAEETSVEELPAVPSEEPESAAEPEEVVGESIEEVEAAEPELVPDAVWYQPGTWFIPPCWDVGFQFGLNNATGNTEASSMQVGANAKRKTEEMVFTLKMQYSQGQNNGVENENQAFLMSRNEWTLGESPWNVFITGTLEYDQFRAFDLRLSSHAGLGYLFFDTERLEVAGRLGSGVSREYGGPDDEYVPEASLGGDFEWCITKAQKLSTNADYYPDWSDFTDYRINCEAGWEIALDGPMDISLKLSIIDRYDSTPNGRKHNDLSTALLVIWKP